MANEKQSTFDSLVAGLDDDERKKILTQLKNVSSSANVPEFHVERTDAGGLGTVSHQLKKESVFYYFVLWVRSFVSRKRVEKVYNDDLVASLARKINSHSSGVIDYQRRMLGPVFYEHIQQLRSCAEFFKPYVSLVNDYPGEFYVFLSAYLVPEIAEEIKREVDPYTIPFSLEITSETRVSKVRALENILRKISPDARAVLYDSIKRVEWLIQFTSLPYMHFLVQFEAAGGSVNGCHFKNARDDFPAFARVFSSASSVPPETLQALFLFYRKKNTTTFVADSVDEKTLREFVENCAMRFSQIKSFVFETSLGDLGRVVFHSYDWQCEKFGGAEDWFQKFQDEWKKIFNARWDNWLRDKKKSQFAELLEMSFGLRSFPELPCQPWKDLWGGLVVGGEITAGFIAWFVRNKMEDAMNTMNTLLISGMFVKIENRNELSDAIGSLADIGKETNKFCAEFEKDGKYGILFDKLINDSLRSIQAQSQVDSIVLATETQIRELTKKVCDTCRSIERILYGIFEEKKKSDYDGVRNLRSIDGPNNEAYIQNLADARSLFANLQTVLTEIEPLDLPRYSAR